jgi:hypothetical protein
MVTFLCAHHPFVVLHAVFANLAVFLPAAVLGPHTGIEALTISNARPSAVVALGVAADDERSASAATLRLVA